MLIDRFNRKLTYLRVSVTDKCNLRCCYCMPPRGVKFLSHDQVLRNEEFLHFIGLFAGLGVRKVRFTGGEPLVRKGFIDIVRNTRERYPDMELCLTSNGTLIGEFIDDLIACRVKNINVSLDSLDEGRYREITGSNEMKQVLANIDRLIDSGYFHLKVNAVLMPETIGELDSFLGYFSEKPVTLRFIERMPFVHDERDGAFISTDRLIEALSQRGDLVRSERSDTSVAEMFTLHCRGRRPVRIGVIPAMSHKFCSRCNRLRLTSDGLLKTCLLSNAEYDLKTPYRMDMGDEEIIRIIDRAISEKKREHEISCATEDRGCGALNPARGMRMIGG